MDMKKTVEFSLKAKEDVSAAAASAEKGLAGLIGKVPGWVKTFGALAAGMAFGKFFKASVEEAMEAEKGMARLGQAVKNAGGNFQTLAPALEGAVDRIRQLSTYTDDDLREALTRVITVTGDTAGSMKNLGLVADLAAARNMGLSEAADVVAKAMNGNTTALNKMGIAGKDSATAIENLRQAVGGFAETEGKTLSGFLERVKNGWADFQEAVGKAITGNAQLGGAMEGLVGMLSSLAAFVEENADAIGAITGALIDLGQAAWEVARVPLKLIGTVLLALTSTAGRFLEAIGTVVSKGGALLRKFGVDFPPAMGESIRTAGVAMQKAAETGYEALWREVKKGEQKATDEAEGHGKRRAEATEQENQRKVASHKKATADITKAIGELQPKLAQQQESWRKEAELAEAVAAELKKLNPLYGELKAAPSTFPTSKALEDMAAQADAAAEKSGTLKENLRDGIGAAIGFASGLGLISDAAANAANNLLNVAGNIGKAMAGDVSGIAGVLGGLTGVLGALFNGDSPATQAFKRLQEQHNQLLADNNARIGDLLRLNSTGSQWSGVQAALQSLTGQNLPNSPIKGVSFDQVLQALAGSGVRLSDLKAVAADLGMEDVVSNLKPGGVLMQSRIAMLLQQMGASEFTQFGQTFAGQMERIRQGRGLGAITEGAEFGQILGAVGIGGGNAITRALAGADFSSMAGRTSAADALRGLFNQLNTGGLTAGDFGGLSGGQFLEALNALVGILTDVGRTIDTAGLPLGNLDIPGIDFAAMIDNGTAQLDALDTQVNWLESIDGRLVALADRLALTEARPAVSVGDVYVQAGADGQTGLEVRGAVLDAIDQALAERYRESQLGQGNVVRVL